MSDNNLNGKDFLLGAFVGGVIGALAALLLAPKSGRELREDISEQYHQVSEKTKVLASDMSRKSQQIVHDVSEKTQAIAQEVSAKGQELAHKAKEIGTKVAEEIREWNESRKQTASAKDQVVPVADEVSTPAALTDQQDENAEQQDKNGEGQ